MRTNKAARGRIEQHANGLGTPTEEMVRERAKEVAQTNGRLPDEYTDSDLAQAREELEGAQTTPSDVTEEDNAYVPREGPLTSSGQLDVPEQAADEQEVPEELVGEGLAEATHDEMREGNARSRRRDEALDDQLPQSED
jgi:hypothetical protein